ncbi:MAG: T9SS type A sorting domain-containing protein [Bacteroidales bacterium]
MIGLQVKKGSAGSWVSVELPEDLELTYIYNNPIVLFGEIVTDRTTEIQIPATPGNNRALFFLNALEGVTDMTLLQQKLTAQLIVDGVAIQGYLFIISAEGSYYSAVFGLLDKDKFTPLLKNLNEIYTGNDSVRIRYDAPIANTGLDILAMRTYDVGADRMANYSDRSSYLPSTNIYTLIKTLLTNLGIAFDETGLTNDNKLYAIKLGQINGTRRNVTSQVTIRQVAGGTITITSPMPEYYQAPNSGGQVLLINYNSKYTITVTRWPSPVNPYIVKLIILKQKNTYYGVANKQVTFTEVATQGDMSAHEFELTEGDLLCFAAINNKISGDDEEQIVYFTMADQGVFTIKNTSEKDLIYGDDYYLKDNLPDITLLTLLQTWGALMSKALILKEVNSGGAVTPTISYKDLTVVNKYTKAIDVPEDNEYAKNFQFGNWGQNNYITFADDDDAHTHAINFPSQNKLLEEEAELFAIPLAQGAAGNNTLICIRDADIEGFTSSSGLPVDGHLTGGRRWEWKETADYIARQTAIGLTPITDIILNDIVGGILSALTQLSINVNISFFEFYNLLTYDIVLFKGRRYAVEEAEYNDGVATLSLLAIGDYTPPTPPTPPTPVVPTITIAASATSAVIGTAISFTSTVNPSGGAYQWYRDGGAIAGATGATYVDIQDIAGSYSYYCEYTTAGGAVRSSALRVNWTNPAAPTISIAASSTTPWINNSITLTATVNPSGGAYQWYKDALPIAGATSSTYTDISETPAAHTYFCDYTTGAGTTRSNIVTVTWQLITITISADYTILPIGAQVTLTSAVGATGGAYQWYRDGAAIAGATVSSYQVAVTGNVNDVLRVYSCRYTLGGNTYTSNSLTVEWLRLALSIIATTNALNSGDSVILTATPNISGGAYSWYRDGAYAGSGATLTDSQPDGTYTYTCTYTYQGVMATSNSLEITWGGAMPTTPTVSISASSTTPTTGQTVTLTASGNPSGGNYQWYGNGAAIAGATGATYTHSESSPTTIVYTCDYTLSGVTATSNSISVGWSAPTGPTAYLFQSISVINNYNERLTAGSVATAGGVTLSLTATGAPHTTNVLTGSSAPFSYNSATSYTVTLRVDLTADTITPQIATYLFSRLSVMGVSSGTSYGNYALSITGGGVGSSYIAFTATVGATGASESVSFQISGTIET